MKKIGRNDLCHCGSGKKYKNCCLEQDIKLEKLDKFYATLKAYNYELLEKANVPFYVGANFGDAIDFGITCNALSLIKSKLLFNSISITTALNVRNLIEYLTLLYMDEKGDITDEQKELFVEQYKLIEYDSYARGDSDRYKELLNLDDLKARYDSAKGKFLKVVGTESKLKNIISTRVPFLCDKKSNYNVLIEKYCPQLLKPYTILSRMVHPSSYCFQRNEKLFNEVCWEIIDSVVAKYTDKVTTQNKTTFTQENQLIYVNYSYGKMLEDILLEQIQVLKTICDEFQRVYGVNSYVKNFLAEVMFNLDDINTDSQLGYCENVKIKFKVIAEMFACFQRVYIDNILGDYESGYLYEMLKFHDYMNIKAQEGEEVTEQQKELIYQRFKRNHPDSEMTKDNFLKEYNKPLGFLVDSSGNVPNLVQLVSEFFDKRYGDEKLENNNVKAQDFFRIVYKESNNMAHGNGYLYFSNIGAWGDDVSAVQFLDHSIIYLLTDIGSIFEKYENDSEDNKKISELIKKSFLKLHLLLYQKMDILKNGKRVIKTF